MLTLQRNEEKFWSNPEPNGIKWRLINFRLISAFPIGPINCLLIELKLNQMVLISSQMVLSLLLICDDPPQSKSHSVHRRRRIEYMPLQGKDHLSLFCPTTYSAPQQRHSYFSLWPPQGVLLEEGTHMVFSTSWAAPDTHWSHSVYGRIWPHAICQKKAKRFRPLTQWRPKWRSFLCCFGYFWELAANCFMNFQTLVGGITYKKYSHLYQWKQTPKSIRSPNPPPALPRRRSIHVDMSACLSIRWFFCVWGWSPANIILNCLSNKSPFNALVTLKVKHQTM